MAQHNKRKFGQVTGATAFGSAVTTILLWTLHAAWGIELSGEVQGAITTLVVLIAGYLVPPQGDEVIEETVDIEIDEPADPGHTAGEQPGL